MICLSHVYHWFDMVEVQALQLSYLGKLHFIHLLTQPSFIFFLLQAYITLHPVSVEGQEISGAFSTEGLNLQQAVLSQTGISGDVSLELNQHVSLTDAKGLQLSTGADVSSHVSISLYLLT